METKLDASADEPRTSPTRSPGPTQPGGGRRRTAFPALCSSVPWLRLRSRSGDRLVAIHRHQCAHPRHRARHAGRQHAVPAHGAARRERRQLLETDAAAARDHPLRPAIDVSGHRTRRDCRGGDRFARLEQHLRPVLVDGHAAVRARSQDGDAHRRRQLDLRSCGRDGDRAGGARTRRAGYGGRIDRGGVRHAGDLPLPRALPLHQPRIICSRMSPSSYGIYAGSTIHEVAQVVAAGRVDQ